MKSTVLLICLAAAVGLLATAESKSDEQSKDATPSKAESSDKFIGKKWGEVRIDNGLKMKLVWCPPGIFRMQQVDLIVELPAEKDEVKPADERVAKNDDEPRDDDVARKGEVAPEGEVEISVSVTPVKVFLTKGYWLGKYEVTQSEWKQVMQTEPWKGQEHTKEGADFPADNVNWHDASDFCRKLTEQERQAGRLSNEWEYTLPTEAQWERACRARTETAFSFGDDESKLGDYAWFFANAWNVGEEYAHRVGQKMPNPWGLYDMHGNVCEWCRDVHSDNLPGGRDPEVKADKATKCSDRVLRGGCFAYDSGSCQSGGRFMYRPGKRSSGYGFRVALSSVQSAK